ncbi:hypothetical protein VTO73DRAFT_15279 [Trametes versicolor]
MANEQWSSSVKENETIWKSLALSRYRLEAADLAGKVHDRKKHQHGRGFIILYLERVVQTIAWTKHGGPAGLNKILRAELVEYERRHGNKKGFKYPADHNPGETYDVEVYPPQAEPAPANDQEADAYTMGSKVLAGYKNGLPSWLWKACNIALDATYSNTQARERAKALRRFLKHDISRYPDRPQQPMSDNNRTVGPRRALGNAPRIPSMEKWGQPVQGLTFKRAVGDTNGYYEWNRAYRNRLFGQLNVAISRLGSDSWENLRWEVYDKYVESLDRGIRYDAATETWTDPAKAWLDLHKYDLETLSKSLRGNCRAGEKFNSLLPLKW